MHISFKAGIAGIGGNITCKYLRETWLFKNTYQRNIDNDNTRYQKILLLTSAVMDYLDSNTPSEGVWGEIDACICIVESLCCPPENITPM